MLLYIDWAFLNSEIGGEKLENILVALAIIAGVLLLKRPLANLLCRIGYEAASKFSGIKNGLFFRQQIQKPVEHLISTAFIFIAFQQLHKLLSKMVLRKVTNSKVMAIRFGDVIDHIFLFFIILYITWTLSKIIGYIYLVEKEKAISNDDKTRQQLLPLVKEMAKIFLWATAFLWVLGTVFHANIPAIITSLGIGGVAIALAAKDTVENFFAAFTMLSDKPFETGDTIKLGSLEGKVERIGFRSTRLRSADGSAYIVPNRKLVGESIENLSNRTTRREKLNLTLALDLKSQNLEVLLVNIKSEVLSIQGVIEPVVVAVDTIGESNYTLAISYYIPQPSEGKTPQAIKQDVNLRLCKLVAKTSFEGEDKNENLPSD